MTETQEASQASFMYSLCLMFGVCRRHLWCPPLSKSNARRHRGAIERLLVSGAAEKRKELHKEPKQERSSSSGARARSGAAASALQRGAAPSRGSLSAATVKEASAGFGPTTWRGACGATILSDATALGGGAGRSRACALHAPHAITTTSSRTPRGQPGDLHRRPRSKHE